MHEGTWELCFAPSYRTVTASRRLNKRWHIYYSGTVAHPLTIMGWIASHQKQTHALGVSNKAPVITCSRLPVCRSCNIFLPEAFCRTIHLLSNDTFLFALAIIMTLAWEIKKNRERWWWGTSRRKGQQINLPFPHTWKFPFEASLKLTLVFDRFQATLESKRLKSHIVSLQRYFLTEQSCMMKPVCRNHYSWIWHNIWLMHTWVSISLNMIGLLEGCWIAKY